MGFDVFPTRKELEKYAEKIPEIEPSPYWPCSAFLRPQNMSALPSMMYWPANTICHGASFGSCSFYTR